MPSRPPGRSTRRSSRSPPSRSATLRTPKPTVAASNEPSAKGRASRSPRQRIFYPELIEAAGDDEVDEVLDRLGPVIEAGRGEEDHGAGLLQRGEAVQVDRRQRRLARHEHELPALLQRDRGGAVDQVR